MRVVTFLVLLALPAAPADLRSLETLFDQFDRNPDARRPLLTKINKILEPWIDQTLRDHGYSPGSPTVTTKLNVELTTRLPEGVVCLTSPSPCIVSIRVEDSRQPYFTFVRTVIELRDSREEEFLYLYEWSRSEWHLRVAINQPTESGPGRRFAVYDVSGDDPYGRRVLACVGLRAERLREKTGLAELSIYGLAPAETVRLLSTSRLVLLGEPLAVRSELTFVEFELPVPSLDSQNRARTALQTYAITPAGAQRVPPIARTPRGFVEEWIAAPWGEAQPMSAADPQLREVHAALHGRQFEGEFMDTATCAAPRTYEVGIDLSGVPGIYFHVQSTGPGQFVLLKTEATPDKEHCAP